MQGSPKNPRGGGRTGKQPHVSGAVQSAGYAVYTALGFGLAGVGDIYVCMYSCTIYMVYTLYAVKGGGTGPGRSKGVKNIGGKRGVSLGGGQHVHVRAFRLTRLRSHGAGGMGMVQLGLGDYASKPWFGGRKVWREVHTHRPPG